MKKRQRKIDLTNPAQWHDMAAEAIDDIAHQALILDIQQLDTYDPAAFVDAPDMMFVEGTNAVSVWKLWPNSPAHLIRILGPEGPAFVLIGRRPEPRDVYLTQSILLLRNLTAIAAVQWSDLKVA